MVTKDGKAYWLGGNNFCCPECVSILEATDRDVLPIAVPEPKGWTCSHYTRHEGSRVRYMWELHQAVEDEQRLVDATVDSLNQTQEELRKVITQAQELTQEEIKKEVARNERRRQPRGGGFIGRS